MNSLRLVRELGQPLTRTFQARLNQGFISIPPETRGTFRYPNVSILDLRVSKIFKINNQSFEAMIDLFNALNAGTVTNEPGDDARPVLRQAVEAAVTADRGLRREVQVLMGEVMNRASMRLVAIATLTAALAASGPLSSVVSTQTTGGLLTIETLVDIKHPSAASWAPDGRHLAENTCSTTRGTG